MKTYLSPKIERRESVIHNNGIFSKVIILQDEVIAIKGGELFSKKELESKEYIGHPELQVTETIFIAPKSNELWWESMIAINHSCEPNVGMRGDIVFVAMKDILPDTELTIDYGMIDNQNYSMFCSCKSQNCRKIITGKDYKLSKFKDYKKYCSSYIQTLL